MNIEELIRSRHSVRSYTDRIIEPSVEQELTDCITGCNQVSGLHIQLVTDEPDAFGKSLMARYGKFKNVRNYLCLAGKKAKDTEMQLGYYGEKIVLEAQRLGLNSCWVGLTYSKGKVPCQLEDTERIYALVALGYGDTAGKTHKIKSPQQVGGDISSAPEWFKNGVDLALLAPTAMNQQKFSFEYIEGNKVKASAGRGFFTQMDLGIARQHFEIGAGDVKVEWA